MEVLWSHLAFWIDFTLTWIVFGGEVVSSFWTSAVFLKLTATDLGRNRLEDMTDIGFGPGEVGFGERADLGASSSELLPSS